MKSHPLIAALRLWIRGEQSTNDFHKALAEVEEALPEEPLAIVPCAWLVEAADACDSHSSEMSYGSGGLRDLAAKLRGAVGSC